MATKDRQCEVTGWLILASWSAFAWAVRQAARLLRNHEFALWLEQAWLEQARNCCSGRGR